MKRSSPLQALASSPTMVGAITTLIVIVAVFLAYNANNGLPFVPVYRVSVELPNAAAPGPEQRGQDRRHPGRRRSSRSTPCGCRATTREPTPPRTATPAASSPAQPEARQVGRRRSRELDLPDSLQVVVRAQVPRDHPRERDGAEGFTQRDHDNDDPRDDELRVIAESPRPSSRRPSSTRSATRSTRRPANAIRQNLAGYGDAFAGRGASLNQAIEALNPLLTTCARSPRR